MPVGNQAPSFAKFAREAPALMRTLASRFQPPAPGEKLGNGQPVLVVPGFMANDASTSLLRRTLAARGFDVHGWGQGTNWGARPALIKALRKHLKRIYKASGQPVIVIGWSLGGMFARYLAHRHPKRVAAVVTLGSPFSGSPRANNAWRVYELVNDHRVDAPPIDFDLSQKPPAYTVAVWSPHDGLVAPSSARGREHEVDESIEIAASHMGLGSRAHSIEEIVRLIVRLAGEGVEPPATDPESP